MSAALDSSPPPRRRARMRKSGVGRSPHAPAAHPGRRWLWLIPALAFSALALLAVLSFDAADSGAWDETRTTHNWIGPFGHGLAWLLFHAVGVSAYGLVAMVITVTVLACARNGRRLAPLATFGWVLAGCTTSALAYLVANPARWGYPPGGALGRALGDAARGAFSFTGSLIILGALFLMALLLATHFKVAHAFDFAARGVGHVSATAARRAYAVYDRRRRARLMQIDDPDAPADAIEPRGREDVRWPPIGAYLSPPDASPGEDDSQPPPVRKSDPRVSSPAAEGPRETAPTSNPPRIVLPDVPPESQPPEPAAKTRGAKAGKTAPTESITEPPRPPPPPADALTDPPPARTVSNAPKSPAIVEPRPPPKPFAPSRPAPEFHMVAGNTGFHLPRQNEILEAQAHTARLIDRAALTATAEKLRQKLIDLGVLGEVTEIRPGPVVTMYEFKPAAGVKLSRIASLSDDLAMAMEAMRVRIVAPIPGKGVVGFEVPNRTRETVFLKDIVEQEVFQKGHSRLTMAIGKDIEGLPYVADLARMPHLLIAGTTGSGKSVGVNSMLMSMLMRATPEELRFLMVDPKMLELSIYEGIPHLLLPVVTDPKKAALALRWGVEEMERRYAMLAEVGVRNIGGYNRFVERDLLEKALKKVEPEQLQMPGVSNGAAAEEEPEEPRKKLPYIVIVIDELADLMMVAAKEVEIYIARLAQMARAAGIHLLVATQRPSTDVLTGVIKANFPSRISFQVASRHDSGTIINTPGAENLLGMGDMLILPPGTSSLTRVHGAYVSELEINRLTAFWKAQGAPVYDTEILRPRDEDGEFSAEDEIADELYEQALAALSDMRQVSISLLQRKMRIGYNRAARMIERMEREGVVGAADGAKPRDVLLRPSV